VEIKRNPYAPSSAVLGAEETPHSMVLASKWRRFGTLLVDYVGFLLISLLVGLAIGALFGERGVQFIKAIPDFLVGSIMLVAYYLFFESLWARTPGKLVFGTVVVTESGSKPTLWQIAGRTLCRFIPFEPFSFLGARGWHDSASGTRVILAKP
jgi:uncharacterized RDD family membrane protein YckC